MCIYAGSSFQARARTQTPSVSGPKRQATHGGPRTAKRCATDGTAVIVASASEGVKQGVLGEWWPWDTRVGCPHFTDVRTKHLRGIACPTLPYRRAAPDVEDSKNHHSRAFNAGIHRLKKSLKKRTANAFCDSLSFTIRCPPFCAPTLPGCRMHRSHVIIAHR